ncbi:GntR family transcriptional regulator [Lactiplantibacillus mudanjiangensis]|uniref:GntR family transcriptional regulator [Lactobacillus pentosus] n=1 Tax=Lactiplantibacillus mudanjiangensis TaxID=1296538 RepID=A0A660E4V2_9LACO|nr:GntR family transcriptional regulator [Lactiplantibacillus mudanjiangensis]VDG22986.1 GntR family transcriptional regulator [Lactobacillus pentosus] [Lactiplantibacillus mudanjiangensis]VDG29156.1 GntR family transcriptional regulator [Lactobacillus pentosus] [Lactiplantibacillus mudanjiangensis]
MVVIDRQSGQPYYAQLVTGIQQDIAHGLWQPGEQLPSVRELAKQHLLNPNTVSKAYKQLEQLQVIQAVPGKGSYVTAATTKTAQSEIQQQLVQLVQQAAQVGISISLLQTWLTQMEEQ